MDIKLFLFVSLLGIGVVLYAALKGKPEPEHAPPDKELETSLQEFMDELEKENQYLLQTIEQLQSGLKREIAADRERIAKLEEKVERFLERSGNRETAREPEAAPTLVFNEHYSRVVTMAKEGRTPEQISKDTGIGMGEIQMILNLVKRENAS